MIPWPLAALAVVYGLLAFLSAVRVVTCLAVRDWLGVGWSGLWFAVTAVACVGLPAQRELGRKCAIIGAVLFLPVALRVAVQHVLQTPPRPDGALISVALAGVAMIILRYLRRPVIKAQFK